jgi:hypothetical protein
VSIGFGSFFEPSDRVITTECLQKSDYRGLSPETVAYTMEDPSIMAMESIIVKSWRKPPKDTIQLETVLRREAAP